MPRKKSSDSTRKPVPSKMGLFPSRLEKAMKARGVVPAELARRSGVDAGTLSRWLDGTGWEGATGARFARIAIELEVSLDWLLLGEEPMDIGARDADFALFFEDSERGKRAARALESRLRAVREESDPVSDKLKPADNA